MNFFCIFVLQNVWVYFHYLPYDGQGCRGVVRETYTPDWTPVCHSASHTFVSSFTPFSKTKGFYVK